jgi:nicotinamide-nucleotide amidase
MNAHDQAVRLAEMLAANRQRIVFTESCTGGLVAATLAQMPGISAYLCGSAVVYREATKREWLGVSADELAEFTAVSEPVARQMALGVLQRTPEADLAASITGHLGPDAPADVDGLVYIGLARREGGQSVVVSVTRHHLARASRIARQQEAAGLVIRRVIDGLGTPS